VSPSGYSPAPAFNLDIFDQGREAASMMGNTDVLVYHGSTDAPTVDVAETGVGAGTIVDDIFYNNFQGYLELGTADYELTVQDMSGTTDVASFGAPLSTLGLEGKAITVLASGFLDPTMNSNGPAFGLWVSLGSAGSLVPLPSVTTGIVEQTIIDNLNVYPNPVNDVLNYSYEIVESTSAELTILNTMGIKVYSKILGDLNQGNYRETIETYDLPSGFYFVNFVSNKGVISQKIQIIK
jgi:hypothetical protein